MFTLKSLYKTNQKLMQSSARPSLAKTAFRGFSSGQMKPPSSGGMSLGTMGLMGASMAGFGYLFYNIQ